MERNCNTCKYVNLQISQEPCYSCSCYSTYNKWKPKIKPIRDLDKIQIICETFKSDYCSKCPLSYDYRFRDLVVCSLEMMPKAKMHEEIKTVLDDMMFEVSDE